MQNPEFATAYHDRRQVKTDKRRAGSNFDYESAGGYYVPTALQNSDAQRFIFTKTLTREQEEACNMVTSGYSLNEKVHHDYIHIVNELRRMDYAEKI
jgi:hypothetical protein